MVGSTSITFTGRKKIYRSRELETLQFGPIREKLMNAMLLEKIRVDFGVEEDTSPGHHKEDGNDTKLEQADNG